MIAGGSPGTYNLVELRLDEIKPYVSDWNRLAVRARTPFLTVEWLTAWCQAFEPRQPVWLVLCGSDGALRAGACLRRLRNGLAGTANDHTGEWDVVAADGSARLEMWGQIARTGGRRLVLPELVAGAETAGIACRALREGGFRVIPRRGPLSPFLRLPPGWDELLGSVSSNLRQQFRRARRGLEGQGELTFRTTSAASELGADLEKVFWVEAAGWKARARTAIICDSRAEALYRAFADDAFAQGWLRLHILELDGEPVAADYACAFGGGGFLLKTGYDERYSKLSPGLVLRGEVLRHSIQESLEFYEFLGAPDVYKIRWTRELRPRITIRAYRGPSTVPEVVYWSRLRARLKRARDRLVELPRGR